MFYFTLHVVDHNQGGQIKKQQGCKGTDRNFLKKV